MFRLIAQMITQMKALEPFDLDSLSDASLAVSLLIPARNSTHSLENTAETALRFMQERYPGEFEVILIPNSVPLSAEDESFIVAKRLAEKHPEIRVCAHDSPVGKGAALRTGLRAARGRWIFFTDADLPYDLEFFDRAAKQLRNGYHLVTGNRRNPVSHFHIPVSLLPLAYGRHRLGLWFNRVVRWFLPIRTVDTQAGIKTMTRELALEAVTRQACPGFFFDLEFFLSAYGLDYRHIDLPITLHLNTEKSTVRVLRESILAGFWLARIFWRSRRGVYGKAQRSARETILSRYHPIPWSTRFFLNVRWHFTPYSLMASRLPLKGDILDLGCGHGLLSIETALDHPERKVLGLDHDVERINLATLAAKGIENLTFEQGGMNQFSLGQTFSGITMIDVMHYFEPTSQEELVQSAYNHLQSGGTLLVREVDPQGGLASSFNRFYERVATGIGFTQANKKGLHFRSIEDWEELFRKAGFKVHSEPCSSFLFSDVLFICERTS